MCQNIKVTRKQTPHSEVYLLALVRISVSLKGSGWLLKVDGIAPVLRLESGSCRHSPALKNYNIFTALFFVCKCLTNTLITLDYKKK